jgi:hypothetical protein
MSDSEEETKERPVVVKGGKEAIRDDIYESALAMVKQQRREKEYLRKVSR